MSAVKMPEIGSAGDARPQSCQPTWVRPVSARVMPMVRPRRMKSVARVTMKDGSRVRTTR